MTNIRPDPMGMPVDPFRSSVNSGFEVIEPEFAKLFMPAANLWRLYDRCQWAEGPVYLPMSRCVVWSDVPGDRQLRWDETTGGVGIFRTPSHFSNGAAVDRQGRLVICEQGRRQIVRIGFDGNEEMLASHYEGARLNSPNDVVVKSDGSIWFTDPAYGIDNSYEGIAAPQEQKSCCVFRLDPRTGRLDVAADDFVRPNGIAFSADERYLLVADTGATHVEAGPRHIRRFEVRDDNSLAGGAVLAECSAGLFDGFCVDEGSRIWTSSQDGVHCLDGGGHLIGKIKVPEIVSNACFGGLSRNCLYITATTSLYRVKLFACGAKTI